MVILRLSSRTFWTYSLGEGNSAYLNLGLPIYKMEIIISYFINMVSTLAQILIQFQSTHHCIESSQWKNPFHSNICNCLELTNQPWPWLLHDLSSPWGFCDIKEDVVITGVHVWGSQHGPLDGDGLPLLQLNHNISYKEGRAVIFGQNVDRKLVTDAVISIEYPENHKVFGGVTVIMVIADSASLKIWHSEEKSFPSWEESRGRAAWAGRITPGRGNRKVAQLITPLPPETTRVLPHIQRGWGRKNHHCLQISPVKNGFNSPDKLLIK